MDFVGFSPLFCSRLRTKTEAIFRIPQSSTLTNIIMADLDFLDFNSDSRPVVYVLRDEDLRKFAANLIKAGRKEREQEIRDESTSDIYYTRAEVKKILKRCDSTLTKWATSGYLVPCYVGGKYLYRKSDVDVILKRRIIR